MSESDTRHRHGTTGHDHEGGDVPHSHDWPLPKTSPGGSKDGGHSLTKIVLIILVSLVLLATAASFFDPNLNYPVVSQVACSIKGDTWYSGGILGSPGCYRPS